MFDSNASRIAVGLPLQKHCFWPSIAVLLTSKSSAFQPPIPLLLKAFESRLNWPQNRGSIALQSRFNWSSIEARLWRQNKRDWNHGKGLRRTARILGSTEHTELAENTLAVPMLGTMRWLFVGEALKLIMIYDLWITIFQLTSSQMRPRRSRWEHQHPTTARQGSWATHPSVHSVKVFTCFRGHKSTEAA